MALYRQASGRQLPGYEIRRLRLAWCRALGGQGLAVVVGDCCAVLSAEELVAALGRPVVESLRCVLPPSRRFVAGKR